MKKRSDQHRPAKVRPLSAEEIAIWRKVAETASPLRPQPAPELEKHLKTVEKASAKSIGNKAASRPATNAVVAAAAAAHMPRIAGLNRRDTQKLARGNVEIDGRIDLHGMSVARARSALLSFIEASREEGRRNVLVITGKGASPFTRHTLHSVDVYHAPERKGVLRSELPQWLHEREFSQHVVGFQPAHPRHGGGGAFYVRLRRKEVRR